MTKKTTKFQSKRLLYVIPIVVLIYALIKLILGQFVINISDSHQGTIFWKTDEKPVKSDFVFFDFKHKLLPKGLKVLSKKLVCIEDDKLRINDKFIVCNNQKYSIKRNQKTGGNKPTKQFYYDGIVPKNKAVVWGSNLESFDSRYWGFVNYNKLRKMRLIF